MPFYQPDELRSYRFDLFEIPGIIQGIYTRQGGVSPEPWASLNHGGTVGDERAHVVENRRLVFEAVNRKVESVFDVWQVHGTDVVCAGSPRPLDALHQKADAILTDRPEITLFMRFADCVPIFLHDPVRRVVGIVHAGWQGTVRKAAAVAVETMKTRYHSKPEDIMAGIGPSICVDHYQVGQDVIVQVQAAFGANAEGLLSRHNGSVHFDLWQANQLVLETSGVRQIQVAGICTACNTGDWYSHRAEKGKTGRFGAILAMQER